MKKPVIDSKKPDYRFQKLTQYVVEKSSPQDQFQQAVSPEKEAEEIVKKRNAIKRHEGVPLYED